MNKKKIISLILAFTSVFCMAGTGVGCGNDVVIPTFEKNPNKKLYFTAYSPPPPANWNGTARNPNCLTEECYQQLEDAGFNRCYALLEGQYVGPTPTTDINGDGKVDVYDRIEVWSEKAVEDAVVACELAEKHGIEYFVRDWSFYGLVTRYLSEGIDEYEEYDRILAKMFDENNPYIDMPGYAGQFGHDEPSVEQMKQIQMQAELYYKYIEQNSSQGGQFYINLLPCYASNAHLSGSAASVSYEEYIDFYIETFRPYVNYICYDYYPFLENSYDGSQLRETYLYNLELVARKCKETGLEHHTFLQSRWDAANMRALTSIGDLRLQVYTEMAFGSNNFVYYTYSSAGNDYKRALLDYTTGETTWVYDAAKTVNNEVLAWEDVYLAFDWDGVMYHNADEMIDNQSFANLLYPMESHDRIKKIDSTEDTLVGVFKNDDGLDAFMFVNYTDPYFDKDDTVTVTFKDAKALLTYRLGQKVVVPLDKNGSYTFKLYPGEGRFIIPLK